MNNNQTKKLIKLESLDNTQIEDKLQKLSLEEVSFIQGGLLISEPIKLISEPIKLPKTNNSPRIPNFLPAPRDYPRIPKCLPIPGDYPRIPEYPPMPVIL